MIKKTRVKIQTNQIVIRTFENAVYWVVQDIDDYEKLKRSISHRLMTYVQDFQSKTQEMNEEIKKEDETQLKYLTSVTANLN
jgi:prefoldin subunit 5